MVALLGGALAVLLLMLAPDRDAATKTVARTPAPRRAGAPVAPVTHRTAPRHPRILPVAPSDAVVTLRSPTAGSRVPASFLGISTEYWSLPLFQRYGRLLDRALSLFETPGQGPLILRIGGDSADHTFWNLKRHRPPGWVLDLGPRWLGGLSALVRRVDARVILDLNLVTDSPLIAAQWADVAARSLPRGRLIGFEVGNEPDLYARRYWEDALEQPIVSMRALPNHISPAVYVRDFQAYSRTLAKVAPRVPLLGPAAANPVSDLRWVKALLTSAHPGLGEVSGHVYPYSACALPSSSTYPTVARVLSQNATAGIAHRLRPAIALARRAGLPFRLTEINSVTCGGKPGVSDTFATALWAPDALFELVRAGVDGVNVHIRARAVNAAFSLDQRGMIAHPLLYGLLLFDRMLGPRARLATTRLSLPARVASATHLKVWVVRVSGGGLHVLLIDKGTRSVRVDLRLPASGPATLERLLAPGARARSGVTLAGQRLGSDGRWHGVPRSETVWPGPRGYLVTVSRTSAALIGLRPAPSAARARLLRASACCPPRSARLSRLQSPRRPRLRSGAGWRPGPAARPGGRVSPFRWAGHRDRPL